MIDARNTRLYIPTSDGITTRRGTRVYVTRYAPTFVINRVVRYNTIVDLFFLINQRHAPVLKAKYAAYASFSAPT